MSNCSKSKVCGLLLLCVMVNVNAQQWVTIDLTDKATFQKVSSGGTPSQALKLRYIPHVTLDWYSEAGQLLLSERVIDPRAMWPLLQNIDGVVSHQVFILSNKQHMRFKAPMEARSLDIHYLNTDLSPSSKTVPIGNIRGVSDALSE